MQTIDSFSAGCPGLVKTGEHMPLGSRIRNVVSILPGQPHYVPIVEYACAKQGETIDLHTR